ncbi:MAG TPA: SRPBCC family protein [Hyphomicrobiales bacterium]|nr:SRPBCC family protein [Hyphomicrobiales bacterium]
MTLTIAPAPVRSSVRVNATQRRAFEVFTAGMGRWWLKTHKIGAVEMADTVVEPRVGGRWYEKGVDGTECEWGRVLAWEPPSRLVLAWQINGRWQFDPDLVTEVEIRFIPDGEDGTRVELEHRNIERFGAEADAARAAFDSPGGWPGLLGSFAAIFP